MKKMIMCTLLFVVGSSVLSLAAGNIEPRRMPVKPDKAQIAPGYDPHHVEVKFLDETDIGLSSEGIPHDRSTQVLRSSEAAQVLQSIADAGGSWRRMSAIAEREMDEMVATAEENVKRDIADINNYFILKVPDNISAVEWIDQLNSLPEVEIALAIPLAMPAPMVPGSYQASQGYLNNATDGIGASAAWGTSGGTGWPPTYGPIRIRDFEYSWNLSHSDLPIVFYDHPPANTPSDPFSDNNHGTAVLGEMGSLNNGWGTTGAVYAAVLSAGPTYLDASWQLGTAMSWGLSALSAGDVFLIEQQMAGPNYTGFPPGTQDGLIPIEWWLSWYNIVVTAVGNGIHVVEAAGNGREDLDAAVYGMGNGGHWPFLAGNNSGAIIVGAGAAPAGFGGSDTDRSRMWFSNWGSRVNLQGWGERVVTLAYADLYAAEGTNLWYTATFSGTSSASPIVASAVAILEGIYQEGHGGIPLPPATMRSILMSTGSPQQAGTYPTSQNIGPRPNLAAAIPLLPCCINRGNVDGIIGVGGPVDVADLTYLVAYLFQMGPVPPCIAEGNVDSIVGVGGPIDVADLTYLVAYLFQMGPTPPPCP